jgi:hypothetical protein
VIIELVQQTGTPLSRLSLRERVFLRRYFRGDSLTAPPRNVYSAVDPTAPIRVHNDQLEFIMTDCGRNQREVPVNF